MLSEPLLSEQARHQARPCQAQDSPTEFALGALGQAVLGRKLGWRAAPRVGWWRPFQTSM